MASHLPMLATSSVLDIKEPVQRRSAISGSHACAGIRGIMGDHNAITDLGTMSLPTTAKMVSFAPRCSRWLYTLFAPQASCASESFAPLYANSHLKFQDGLKVNDYMGTSVGFPSDGVPDQGWKLYFASLVMVGVAGLFVVARILTRIATRQFGADDSTILVSLVSRIFAIFPSDGQLT